MARAIDPVNGRKWEERLRRYADSQLTVGEFCVWDGVSVAAFYVWRKKLGTDGIVTRNFTGFDVSTRPGFSWVCKYLGSAHVLEACGPPADLRMNFVNADVMCTADDQTACRLRTDWPWALWVLSAALPVHAIHGLDKIVSLPRRDSQRVVVGEFSAEIC